MKDHLRNIKNHLGLILFFAAVAIFAIYYLTIIDPKYNDTATVIAVTTLVTSLLTSSIIAYAEKSGWLANYESRLSSFEGNLQKQFSSIDKKIEKIPNAVKERLVFGLEKIEQPFVEETFIGDHQNGEICWLNTYFRDWEKKPDIIERALRSGARVRLLFLSPISHTKFDRVYYVSSTQKKEDRDTSTHSETSFSAEAQFSHQLNQNYWACENLQKTMIAKLGDKYIQGSLEIRFYDDSSQLPMILKCNTPSNSDTQISQEFIPIEGASGFYLDNYSSELPYIIWNNLDEKGDQEVLTNLYSYFDKKWERSSVKTLADLEDTMRKNSSEAKTNHQD